MLYLTATVWVDHPTLASFGNLCAWQCYVRHEIWLPKLGSEYFKILQLLLDRVLSSSVDCTPPRQITYVRSTLSFGHID